MILCDTNVFIHAFNGNKTTIAQMKVIGLEEIALSAITLMELYQGMGNKTELAQIKKNYVSTILFMLTVTFQKWRLS